VTRRLGVNFQYRSSHTSKKYLLETMGPAVALFEYDNDDCLDIYFVNGAPLADPTPKGTIPVKTGPQYWNRLYHQQPDGTFEDVTEKAGLQDAGYGMGVAVGDYDNDLTVTSGSAKQADTLYCSSLGYQYFHFRLLSARCDKPWG
jgi:enediyne biosynthesis protein E4